MSNKFFSILSSVSGIPAFIKKHILRLKEEFGSLRHRLNNMAESNMELGIFHLQNGNWSDAVFRFKMVDKYLDPDNKTANYWLGWAYFFKEDYRNSIIYLGKAGDQDKVNLLLFVKSIDSVEEIPLEIYKIHRDIMAEKFVDKFTSFDADIPKDLINELNDVITSLPEEYSILELGSNVGFLGAEIARRMQETYNITATEVSKELVDLQNVCFPDQELYNKMIQVSPEEFLKNTDQKFDVILSLDGISLSSSLKNVFKAASLALADEGYFAFAVQISDKRYFASKSLEFFYESTKIKDELLSAGFNILKTKEFSLEIKNNYSIFVCTK